MFCFFLCEEVPMKKQTLFLFIQESQLVSTFNHRHQILIHRLGATTLPNLRTVTVQSPLKPALKSNTRQHVTVGSNFFINPLDGCRMCGTFFFDKCTRIHVHAVHGDWLIYYISTLTLYISNIYTGFWHRHLPKNSVRDIGGWQINKRKKKLFMALFDHLFAKLMTVKTVKSQL